MIAVVGLAGWLALTAASAERATTTTAALPPPPLIAAGVTADGAPMGPPADWQVTHTDDGVYLLSFAVPTSLSVRSWEAVAGVVARPVTDRTWSVTFLADGVPVETSFSFLAAPRPG